MIFVAGIFLVYNWRNIEEIEEYVPEYVSRIAERERFLRELEIARSVQQKFLPQKSPDIKDIDVAGMCIPAMEVGGDYYDFIELDEERLGVVIGDVSGKGISAAFYMTMVKGIVKSLCSKSLSPGDTLKRMNRIFYENVPRNVFISLIYGIFDLRKREFSFARAGHTAVIIRKKGKEKPDFLFPPGIALGLERGDIFSSVIEEKILEISSGDVFVFYTDGVSETVNTRGEEFGEERLGEIISQISHKRADEIINLIKNKIKEFSIINAQRDDITLVVVKIM